MLTNGTDIIDNGVEFSMKFKIDIRLYLLTIKISRLNISAKLNTDIMSGTFDTASYVVSFFKPCPPHIGLCISGTDVSHKGLVELPGGANCPIVKLYSQKMLCREF